MAEYENKRNPDIPLPNLQQLSVTPKVDLNDLMNLVSESNGTALGEPQDVIDKEVQLRGKYYEETFAVFRDAARAKVPYDPEQTMINYYEQLKGLLDYNQQLTVKIASFDDDFIDGKTINREEYDTQCALLIGLQLHSFDLIRKMGNIAKQYSVDEEYQKWYPYALHYYSGLGLARRGGISLPDIMFPNSSQISTPKQYQFLVESQFIPGAEDYNKIEDSRDQMDPTGEFSFLMEQYSMRVRLIGFAQDAPVYRLQPKGNPKSPQYKAAEHALRFINQAHRIQNESYKILTDPTHPEFEEMKEVFLKFMSFSEESKFIPFMTAGFRSFDDIVDTYRIISQIGSDDPHYDFYTVFKSELLQLADSTKLYDYRLAKEDIDEIYTEPVENTVEPVSTNSNDLIEKVNRGSKKTPYVLEKDTIAGINWRGFVAPESVTVQCFDKNVVRVTFSYTNPETDEATTFIYTCELRSGALDWNLIESPENIEFQSLKSSCQSVLADILEIAIPEKAKKTEYKPDQGKKTKRDHNHDPIYQLRKTVSKSKEQRDTETVIAPMQQIESKQYKPIDFFYDERIEKKLSELSQRELDRFIDACTRFNNRTKQHVGQMKKLTPSERYRLRIGDYRVILEEADDSYRIVDFGKRKDIYG